MADVSLPSGPVMTELGKKKKHHWQSSENPITLWNLVHPFEDLCIKMHYHCCNNCLYYILTVMCAP